MPLVHNLSARISQKACLILPEVFPQTYGLKLSLTLVRLIAEQTLLLQPDPQEQKQLTIVLFKILMLLPYHLHIKMAQK